MSNKKRISLLSDAEIDDIYAFPEFNDQERELYFSFNSMYWAVINSNDIVASQIHTMIKIAYFKAKQRLYKFDFDQMSEDMQYLLERYFDKKQLLPKTIDRRTERHLNELILQTFGYQRYDQNDQRINKHLAMLIKHYPKPHNAARELIKYFEKMQIILPNYRTMQDLYSEVHSQEMSSLHDFIEAIPQDIEDELRKLIHNDNEDDGKAITLQSIRYDQQDFSYTEVRRGVDKINALSKLYQFSKPFLLKTQLAQNAIRYYSELVEQYPVARLRKLTINLQYLYAMCFIYRRYQVLTDQAIVSFIHHIQLLKAEIKEHVDTQMSNYIVSIVKKYPNLVKFFRWFPNQENGDSTSHNDLFEQAYKILPKIYFEKFAKYFEGADFDAKAERWLYVEKNFSTISMYLRPIVLAVDFEHYKKDNSITPLIAILREHYSRNKAPKDLKLSDNLGLSLPPNIVPYLKSLLQDDYVNPHRFEFYTYEKLYHHIDRGRMYCNESVSYKDIDDDFVSDSMVDKASEIAEQFGYPKLANYCDGRLDDLLDELDAKWKHVLNRINTGENESIHITYNDKGQASWQLDYAASIEHDDSFFKDIQKMEIAEIFNFIDSEVSICEAFSHIKGRYVKRTKATKVAMTACILSEAFGFGVSKMAEMSDLKFDNLKSIHEDFIRLETLHDANNLIANFINKLPIFKAWNLLEGKLLADDDGQKASTKTSTIKSRYSKKYLGNVC